MSGSFLPDRAPSLRERERPVVCQGFQPDLDLRGEIWAEPPQQRDRHPSPSSSSLPSHEYKSPPLTPWLVQHTWIWPHLHLLRILSPLIWPWEAPPWTSCIHSHPCRPVHSHNRPKGLTATVLTSPAEQNHLGNFVEITMPRSALECLIAFGSIRAQVLATGCFFNKTPTWC